MDRLYVPSFIHLPSTNTFFTQNFALFHCIGPSIQTALFNAPLVVLLGSDKVPEPATGRLFEVGSGWVGETRWQRTGGVGFPIDKPLTPEEVLSKWETILNFDDGRADHPDDPSAGTAKIMANMENRSAAAKKEKTAAEPNKEILANIEAAKKAKAEGTDFSYDERDVILYSKSKREDAGVSSS